MQDSIIERLLRRIRWLIQTFVWGMDIHPSARISSRAKLDRVWPMGMHVGALTEIADDVIVLTHDVSRNLSAHTFIGERCRIGPRAMVLPGVTIGNDCVVMPGALVVKNMPDGSVATGNPAVVKQRAAEDWPGDER